VQRRQRRLGGEVVVGGAPVREAVAPSSRPLRQGALASDAADLGREHDGFEQVQRSEGPRPPLLGEEEGGATLRVADAERTIEGTGVDDGQHVVGEPAPRVRAVVGWRRAPVPPQVGGDGGDTGQVGHQRAPDQPVEPGGVGQQHRGSAVAPVGAPGQVVHDEVAPVGRGPALHV
jgi:hypothetical protein